MANRETTPALKNSENTWIRDTAMITASGGSGDGGTVVVWANEATLFEGTITASGGGDGGFIEVSGKETLGFIGKVSASGGSGANGQILIDPSGLFVTDAFPPNLNGDGTTGDDTSVASVGPGLRYRIGPNLSNDGDTWQL